MCGGTSEYEVDANLPLGGSFLARSACVLYSDGICALTAVVVVVVFIWFSVASDLDALRVAGVL